MHLRLLIQDYEIEYISVASQQFNLIKLLFAFLCCSSILILIVKNVDFVQEDRRVSHVKDTNRHSIFSKTDGLQVKRLANLYLVS